MASVLPPGWEAHSCCGLGPDAQWRELCIYLVSFAYSRVIRAITDGRSYDPDYEQWEFGKLSALREIALSIEDSYQYYYMGKIFPASIYDLWNR